MADILIMTVELYPDTLPPNTAKLVKVFQSESPNFLNEFYLSGGTALSLQIGHRQLSSVADIACTKLRTIGMRGSKKDFIDLFFC